MYANVDCNVSGLSSLIGVVVLWFNLETVSQSCFSFCRLGCRYSGLSRYVSISLFPTCFVLCTGLFKARRYASSIGFKLLFWKVAMAFETCHLLDSCTRSCHKNSKSISGVHFKMMHPHIYIIILLRKKRAKSWWDCTPMIQVLSQISFLSSPKAVCVCEVG